MVDLCGFALRTSTLSENPKVLASQKSGFEFDSTVKSRRLFSARFYSHFRPTDVGLFQLTMLHKKCESFS